MTAIDPNQFLQPPPWRWLVLACVLAACLAFCVKSCCDMTARNSEAYYKYKESFFRR